MTTKEQGDDYWIIICVDCDGPLEDDDAFVCATCWDIRAGDLAPCPKCGHIVDADQLTSCNDERCDRCRYNALQTADDNRDYYRRIMP